jgi:enoyl-CoA hydratase/carnithine racemase
MNDRVAVRIENGVADVRLTRGDKMNGIDRAMFEALIVTGEALAGEPSLRAVVLSGEGRAFCAGLDVASFANVGLAGIPGADKLEARTHGISNRVQRAVWVWRELPVPVIAAVHGVAYGGGFQIMLGADMRYAAPGTRFSILEIKWGLVPDMCGTQLMRHLAREDVVRELTYTGRIFSAEEAKQYGFLTRIVDDPHRAALETARDIATKSPDAIRAAKRLFNGAATSDVETGLIAEAREQQALIGSRNQLEAMFANLQKREPRFIDAA